MSIVARGIEQWDFWQARQVDHNHQWRYTGFSRHALQSSCISGHCIQSSNQFFCQAASYLPWQQCCTFCAALTWWFWFPCFAVFPWFSNTAAGPISETTFGCGSDSDFTRPALSQPVSLFWRPVNAGSGMMTSMSLACSIMTWGARSLDTEFSHIYHILPSKMPRVKLGEVHALT